MQKDIILTRRSVRKYIPNKEVENEKLEYILKAGMSAPSAGNKRNWEFIVIKNKDTLSKIMNFHPYANMLKTANIAIVVCGDISDDLKKMYWIQNCSAALENMLIAANSVGLGSVWLGITPEIDRINECAKLFSLPEHIQTLGIMALGYPANEVANIDRFDSTKIHYEKF